MISFKEFLVEARTAPLYHGTSFFTFKNYIIADNVISAKTVHQHDRRSHKGLSPSKHVVSLTRSPRFATQWGDRKQSRPMGCVILQLDQEKLTRNHKLIPYNHFQDEIYTDSGGLARELNDVRDSGFPINQYEENVVGSIKNVSNYLQKVYVSNNESLTNAMVVLKGKGIDVPVEIIPKLWWKP